MPSGLRKLDVDFDPGIVAAIDARLSSVEHDQHATVLLAVESGSRAWGFPSPDSDYDCRFIYVRRRDDYLALFQQRDVIEFPPDGLLDVNGWDLAKALRLMLKGNAVVIEWLTSPFIYAGDERFRDECLALARQATRVSAVARHYLHLGERQRRTHFADDGHMEMKRLFYALRPALALRWLRLRGGEAVAPMHFPTLVKECEVSTDVTRIVAELLRQKSVTRELGRGQLPFPVGALIDTEFRLARETWPDKPAPLQPEALTAANTLFRRWVGA